MKKIALIAALLVLALSVPAQAATTYGLWFHSAANITAFLQTYFSSSTSKIGIITGGDVSVFPTLIAKGYQSQEGLGGYAAQAANGDLKTMSPAALYAFIDGIASHGSTFIYVDEPWPAPGETSSASANSVAYNTRGFNLIHAYIQSKYPKISFGLSMADNYGTQLAMLQAGLKVEWVQAEYYNTASGTTTPPPALITIHAQFPNVKASVLVYQLMTMCNDWGNNWITPANLDMIQFWDVDGYGNWIGPLIDMSAIPNAVSMAKNNGAKFFCTAPIAYVDSHYWTWNTQTANFTFQVDDGYYASPHQSTIASCEYQVVSGANAVNGPNDPSVVVTRPWTPRTCGGNITVTVGASGDCRDIGAKTCLTMTRNTTAAGVIGNQTYQEWSISY